METIHRSVILPRNVMLLSALTLGLWSAPLTRGGIVLAEYAFHLDGVLFPNLPPVGADLSAFDTATGLGTVRLGVSGAGSHKVGLFLDHEIDETINTFFNETGASNGSPAAGQTWEIDEPGFVNGDIYDHLTNGVLDNGIGVSVYGATTFPDDVSMALGHDFALAAGQTAQLTFTLGLMPPPGGFYLVHSDPDSGASIYFSSEFGVIPEPGWSWLPLSLAALLAVPAIRRAGSRD